MTAVDDLLPAFGPELAGADGFAEELDRAFEQALRAWPGVTVEPRAFAQTWAGCLAELGGTRPSDVEVADLLLAFACGHDDLAALAAFERAYFGEVDAVCRRVGVVLDVADFEQELRRRLFVGDEDREPRIRDFAGRGTLRNWFRVMVSRLAINHARSAKSRRDVSADEEMLEALAPITSTRPPDLDRQVSQAKYTEAFHRAFEASLAGLPVPDRLVLRYTLVDGLTLDQLGRVLGVHRSTAHRRVQSARDRLVAQTRDELSQRIGVASAELDGVMQDLSVRIEVTLSRVLAK